MPRLVFALAEVGTQRGGLAREPVGFGRRLCALCARGFWGLLPSHTGQHRRGIAAVQARLALPALRCAAADGYIRGPGRCCSSVVEHPLGKGEVDSSILSSSTRDMYSAHHPRKLPVSDATPAFIPPQPPLMSPGKARDVGRI